jgi:hypothetical protein
MDKLLNYIFYDLHNYVGAYPLYKISKQYNKKIKLDEVKKWLRKQEVQQETTKKDIGHKKIYKPIYSDSSYSFQIDLTFLPMYKTQNDGYYVLFTGINVNSRYAYAYWSKNKKAKSILKMLNKFKDNALEIEMITLDSGSEFTNHEAIEWFEENNIKTFFVVDDSHKLGIINRFHRTLKDKLNKYMIAHNNTRWVDVIDKIIYNYNRTVNRGIGFTPLDASKPIVQSTIINDAIDKTKLIVEHIDEDFKIGEKCRVIEKKKLFDKGTDKYSKQIFEIIKIQKNTLTLKNEEGKEIKGIKKDDVVIVNDVEKRISNDNIKKAIKESKIERKIKKEDLGDNIISTKEKRVIKKPSRYN